MVEACIRLAFELFYEWVLILYDFDMNSIYFRDLRITCRSLFYTIATWIRLAFKFCELVLILHDHAMNSICVRVLRIGPDSTVMISASWACSCFRVLRTLIVKFSSWWWYELLVFDLYMWRIRVSARIVRDSPPLSNFLYRRFVGFVFRLAVVIIKLVRAPQNAGAL